MEMGIVNDLKVMNIRSNKMISDGIADGYIPDWLIVELLTRLPQKMIFRLKLVSKQWLSIIIDAYFVKTYCSRVLMLQKLQPWILIPTFRRFKVDEYRYLHDLDVLVDTYSTNFKWPNIYALSLPRLPHPHENEYTIYEVSNGCVLYGSNEATKKGFPEYCNLRMCNPITGQWISLPWLDNYQKFANWGFMTNVEDGVLMSYTVVCMYIATRNQSNFVIFRVFLSEVGEWKNYIVPIDTSIRVDSMSKCAVVNGVMHWICFEGGLIAYDPHKHPDRVCIIPRPNEPELEPFSHMFVAYQGLLKYSEAIDVPCGFNIWVLSDYSSGDWCLEHQIKFADIQNMTTLLEHQVLQIRPAWFHPYDSEIVYLEYDGMIFSYNIKTKKLEVSEEFKQIPRFVPLVSTHFLQIPPWPVSFSRPSVSASED